MFRALILAACLAVPAAAGTLRVATYNVDLGREAPGLLLHELRTGPGPKAMAAAAAIRKARPDVIVLQKFDHDLRGRALDAFAALLAEGPDGIEYRHRFVAPVNAGMPSGLDLDRDGALMRRGDALGWGDFTGSGGIAILSRLPIDAEAAHTFRALLWRDLPGAELPRLPGGLPWFSPEAEAVVPLSSRAHWDVPVLLPGGGQLRLLTAHPTPPLYDGPERLNWRRNRDELLFWLRYLDGWTPADDRGRPAAALAGPFVLLGDFNLDPWDGAGDRDTLGRLLAHPRLQDPEPASAEAAAAARAQGGANRSHAGPARLDTVDWRDAPGPGNLRVDYVLPEARLRVTGAGVLWPAEPSEGPAHRLVWVDLDLGDSAFPRSAMR